MSRAELQNQLARLQERYHALHAEKPQLQEAKPQSAVWAALVHGAS